MQRIESQLIETLVGTGTLSREGTPVAKAAYRLEVRQGIVVTQSNMGEDRLPGNIGVSGTLNLTSGDLGELPFDRFVLTTKDGRQLAVIFDHTSLQASLMGTSSSHSVTAMFIEARRV